MKNDELSFKQFKRQFQNEKIDIVGGESTNRPKVSVCITAYNHEKYIKECLDSVLRQKTNFPVEILVGEDNSTDATRAICESYALKYPERITLFLHQDSNKILVRKAAIGRFNFVYNIYQAKGEYIALIDGDDYWKDPLKLQKQADFLDANTSYVACCHNAVIINSEGRQIHQSKLKLKEDRVYSEKELRQGAFLLTLTLMFRNKVRSFPKEFFEVFNGDTFLISLLGSHGKAKYLHNMIPDAYREHEGSIWSSKNQFEQRYVKLLFARILHQYYERINDLDTREYYKHRIESLVMNLISYPKLGKQYSPKKFRTVLSIYLAYQKPYKSKHHAKHFLKHSYYYISSQLSGHNSPTA
ncbi:hypothetical protein GCM10009117_03790 [Gangjinia marincola]|uniref:Glycosyltransferase 2-like domain-containing protein n=1 Tax=Gangjinia marincola TaxID=578463 RepID=A0ABP3XSB1_9FLAO